jgi:lipopolysaccharide biosynthesis glycosyltransferase
MDSTIFDIELTHGLEFYEFNFEDKNKDILKDYTCINNNNIYIVSFSSKKYITIELEGVKYTINKNFHYNIITKITEPKLKIYNPYEFPSDCLFNFNISQYGNPSLSNTYEYNVVYSFDKNYYAGAFASIYSLVFNFKQDKIKKLMVNLMLEKSDLDSFNIEFDKLRNSYDFNNKFSVYIIDNMLLSDNILTTKCFKGGNHLLKLANFARLLIGNLFNVDQLLYLDSDTIVQSDLSKSFDKMRNKTYIIAGKKSELNFRNILIAPNYDKATELLGETFDINKSIIYTGTLFIKPKESRIIYSRMDKIVNCHNSLPNGLYKLFTMSITNLSLFDSMSYFDDYLVNVVDLGCKKINQNLLINADVLDWSGIYKPWFKNGYYQDYWKKYNLLQYEKPEISTEKNTVETF